MFSRTYDAMKDDQEFNIWFVKEMEKYPCLYNHQDPNYNIRTPQEEAWQMVANAASGTVGECKERWKNIRASFTRHLKHRILELKNGNKAKKPYYLASHLNFLLPFTKARSFPEDNLKYYCDIIKMHDNSENVVYLDSEDDTTYSEELRLSACDTDALNEDDDYTVNDHHLILNADENADLDDPKIHQVFSMQQTSDNNEEDIADIKFQTETLKYKRASDNELDTSAIKRMRNMENDADLSFLKSLLPDMKTMNDGQKRKFKINVLKLIDEILESEGPSTSKTGAGFVFS